MKISTLLLGTMMISPVADLNEPPLEERSVQVEVKVKESPSYSNQGVPFVINLFATEENKTEPIEIGTHVGRTDKKGEAIEHLVYEAHSSMRLHSVRIDAMTQGHDGEKWEGELNQTLKPDSIYTIALLSTSPLK